MSQKRKAKDGGGGAAKPSAPSRDGKLETAVMLNTGLRVGGWVLLVCSRFSFGECETARFVEEATLRSTAHCHGHGTVHRVRPIFDAFGEGLFAVGGRYSSDCVDFSIDVSQLLFLIARAQGERAIAFPAERRTA